MASCWSNTPGYPHLFCAVLLPGTILMNPKPEEYQNSELPHLGTSYSKSNADKHDFQPSILRPYTSEKRIWNVYGNSHYLVKSHTCGWILAGYSVWSLPMHSFSLSSFSRLIALNVHKSCIFTKYILIYGNFWHVKCDLYNHLENRNLKHKDDHFYCSISLYFYTKYNAICYNMIQGMLTSFCFPLYIIFTARCTTIWNNRV